MARLHWNGLYNAAKCELYFVWYNSVAGVACAKVKGREKAISGRNVVIELLRI